MELQQRWLSLSGICDVLGMRPTQIKSLVRSKLLVRIGKPPDFRYLDPTPEYAERLRLWASMDTQTNIPLKALFTVREVTEIMGWHISHGRDVMRTIPATKVNGHTKLYTATQVRDLLFRRQDRKHSQQRDPFLLSGLIAYFRRYYESEAAIVPTDSEFRDDDVLRKKLEWMLEQPNHQKMMADFLEKIELAKAVVSQASQSDTKTPS